MAKSKRNYWSVGARSDTGLVRTENQDRMSRVRAPCGDVYIVVDGMGGHKAGGQAAQITVEELGRELSTLTPKDNIREAVSKAFQMTNEAVYRAAHGGDPETDGMGATAVVLVISGASALVAHVGDSRAYRFRNGRLERLTRDHSRVQRMVEAGMLSEKEAAEHPDASVIERAMGDKPTVDVEIGSSLPVKVGDEFLLCSDGLCGYIDDEAIAEMLRQGGSPQERAEALVDLSLEKGGHDNVTVQLVRYGASTPSRARGGLLAAMLVGICSLAVASYALFLVYSPRPQNPPQNPAPGSQQVLSANERLDKIEKDLERLEAKVKEFKTSERLRPGPSGEGPPAAQQKGTRKHLSGPSKPQHATEKKGSSNQANTSLGEGSGSVAQVDSKPRDSSQTTQDPPSSAANTKAEMPPTTKDLPARDPKGGETTNAAPSIPEHKSDGAQTQ